MNARSCFLFSHVGVLKSYYVSLGVLRFFIRAGAPPLFGVSPLEIFPTPALPSEHRVRTRVLRTHPLSLVILALQSGAFLPPLQCVSPFFPLCFDVNIYFFSPLIPLFFFFVGFDQSQNAFRFRTRLGTACAFPLGPTLLLPSSPFLLHVFFL